MQIGVRPYCMHDSFNGNHTFNYKLPACVSTFRTVFGLFVFVTPWRFAFASNCKPLGHVTHLKSRVHLQQQEFKRYWQTSLVNTPHCTPKRRVESIKRETLDHVTSGDFVVSCYSVLSFSLFCLQNFVLLSIIAFFLFPVKSSASVSSSPAKLAGIIVGVLVFLVLCLIIAVAFRRRISGDEAGKRKGWDVHSQSLDYVCYLTLAICSQEKVAINVLNLYFCTEPLRDLRELIEKVSLR